MTFKSLKELDIFHLSFLSKVSKNKTPWTLELDKHVNLACIVVFTEVVALNDEFGHQRSNL